MNFDRFNDGSQNAPRLRVGQALWGMQELPLNSTQDGTEWTLDEKFERCAEAGFECVECWLSDENEGEVKAALDRHGLKIVLGHRPFSPEDVSQTVERAIRLGADFIFAQPASAYHSLSETVALVSKGRKIANDAGLAFFVETHRNNFTETIRQTNELLTAAPNMRVTGDFSHFVVVGEFYGWADEDAVGKMDTILQRVSHLHGRISNGEAVQVDVGDGSGQTAQFFVQLWARAMKHWRAGAQPGDVLQFSSELGPPRYAITLPDGREFSDRWQQALVMKQLAEQAWQLSGE
ncbi:MAG TPA: TIM barrel protein [Abditibacteriaceae bacterium]|jgi:sugar phosphate isomerase/epimerase